MPRRLSPAGPTFKRAPGAGRAARPLDHLRCPAGASDSALIKSRSTLFRVPARNISDAQYYFPPAALTPASELKKCVMLRLPRVAWSQALHVLGFAYHTIWDRGVGLASRPFYRRRKSGKERWAPAGLVRSTISKNPSISSLNLLSAWCRRIPGRWSWAPRPPPSI